MNLGTHYGIRVPFATQGGTQLGFLGVTVFFVISGFLISTLIFQEMELSGTISLPRFYFRRTFRLLPAYYILIAAVGIGYLLGAVKTTDWNGVVFHALTYTTNYNHTFFVYLGHSWTLSVEEQFYLLWPPTLLLLGKRRGLMFVALLIVICPFVRGYYATLIRPDGPWTANWNLPYRFECVADSLAAGCLLAGGYDWLKSNARYGAFRQSWLVLAAPGWIVLTCVFALPESIQYITRTLTILSITIVLDWSITYPETYLGRILNARPMIFVGVLSYSLYLRQQPFLNPYTQSAISRFPINILLVCVAALASYYCVEKPGLALRDRMDKRLLRTAPTGPLAR